jgi:hypothetical protein
MSTAKIRKILITGGRYSTALSRSIEELMEEYKGLPDVESRVAEELGVKPSTVRTYVPYMDGGQHRLMYDFLVRKWQCYEHRQPFIGPVLILTGADNCDVLWTAFGWESSGYPFRSLCDHVEMAV